MHDEWMTYAQAGERLNITAEAVRQRASRGAWPRRLSNEGMALIRIPETVKPQTTDRRTARQSTGEPPVAPVLNEMAVRLAQAEIELRALRDRLGDAQADRDHWRELARVLAEGRRAPEGVANILDRMKERAATKAA